MIPFYKPKPDKPLKEATPCRCGFVDLHGKDDFVFSFREFPNKIHRSESCGVLATDNNEEPFDPQTI